MMNNKTVVKRKTICAHLDSLSGLLVRFAEKVDCSSRVFSVVSQGIVQVCVSVSGKIYFMCPLQDAAKVVPITFHIS